MAAWLGVCVLELAVVDMTNGEEGRAEWTAAFSDDFERAELGPDWEVEDGEWRIENGRLVGTGTIMCTRRFPGSQRIAYDALTTNESPCDLSAVLSANC